MSVTALRCCRVWFRHRQKSSKVNSDVMFGYLTAHCNPDVCNSTALLSHVVPTSAKKKKKKIQKNTECCSNATRCLFSRPSPAVNPLSVTELRCCRIWFLRRQKVAQYCSNAMFGSGTPGCNPIVCKSIALLSHLVPMSAKRSTVLQ